MLFEEYGGPDKLIIKDLPVPEPAMERYESK